MKVCKYCGNTLENNELFCGNCGIQYRENPVSVPQTKAPQNNIESMNILGGAVTATKEKTQKRLFFGISSLIIVAIIVITFVLDPFATSAFSSASQALRKSVSAQNASFEITVVNGETAEKFSGYAFFNTENKKLTVDMISSDGSGRIVLYNNFLVKIKSNNIYSVSNEAFTVPDIFTIYENLTASTAEKINWAFFVDRLSSKISKNFANNINLFKFSDCANEYIAELQSDEYSKNALGFEKLTEGGKTVISLAPDAYKIISDFVEKVKPSFKNQKSFDTVKKYISDNKSTLQLQDAKLEVEISGNYISQVNAQYREQMNTVGFSVSLSGYGQATASKDLDNIYKTASSLLGDKSSYYSEPNSLFGGFGGNGSMEEFFDNYFKGFFG